ncbi:unnamed protein product, partial [Didymodactylos carnosus]
LEQIFLTELFCNLCKNEYCQIAFCKILDKNTAKTIKDTDMELIKGQLALVLNKMNQIETQLSSLDNHDQDHMYNEF